MTSFTRQVLAVVRRIPIGLVTTYGEVARLSGRPGAARAVGNIMRKAAEPGLPYHRVIAAGGRVGGFGGSPQMKRALLAAEGHTIRGDRLLNVARATWLPKTPRPRTRSAAARPSDRRA